MTDGQIKTLLISGRILEDVKIRPDVDLPRVSPPHAHDGYGMTFDAALGLWAIVGLFNTTFVAATDIISLRFSNTRRAAAA
jgi:hypothetical protein